MDEMYAGHQGLRRKLMLVIPIFFALYPWSKFKDNSNIFKRICQGHMLQAILLPEILVDAKASMAGNPNCWNRPSWSRCQPSSQPRLRGLAPLNAERSWTSQTANLSLDFAAGKMMENAQQWWMTDSTNSWWAELSMKTYHIFASQNSGQWRWQKTICWESSLSLYSKQKGCCMKHLIVLQICQLFQTSRFRFAEQSIWPARSEMNDVL